MKSITQILKKKYLEENILLKENKAIVNARNLKVLRSILVAVTVAYSMNFILPFFFQNLTFTGYAKLRLAYLTMILLAICLYLLIKFRPSMNFVYILYTTYSIALFYCILTSALFSAEYTSVVILAVLFQIPVLYLDKSRRINIFVILCGTLYLLFIFPFKNPEIFVDEAVNTITFTILSLIIGNFTRISLMENLTMRSRLQFFAYTDQLTNLYNRRKLFEDMDDPNYAETVTGLAIVDIDFFKNYNDTYGHQMGDVCLRSISDCFLEFEAKGHLFFYRYGGEEFVAVFHRYSQSEMFNMASQVRQRVEALSIPHSASQLGVVTVSIGIAAFSDPENRQYDILLSEADKALYRAKHNHRNTVVLYQEDELI